MAYLVLDGPDGGGKSTQSRALVEFLRSRGRKVHHLREPGSTPVGEHLRQLLLSPETGDLQPLSEALLFTAARAELVARVIGPALKRGEVVVAERCFASTLAYQCFASQPGVPLDLVLDLTRRAHGPWLPDAVFVLDCDVATAMRRRSARAKDRIEGRDSGFHERVRQGYLEVARRDPTFCVVDARWPFAAVQATLQQRALRFLR